ncbi:MAG TPA: ABC transporter permease, partial [Thermoanaerobaculia bacterium]|nr:ABC transporter permease [Thermoanaerobaculia bacterium]
MTGQGNGAAPAAAAAAVLVMALGLGAAAAALAVLDAVVVRGVPYREPSRLVVLTGTFADQGTVADWPISQLDFADWRRLARSFSEMSVFNDDGDLALNLDGVAEPERLKGELVSDSYFPLLGIQAEFGRFFSRQEDTKPFTDYVTVLSHDLWRRRFGGDPGVIGSQVQLNGQRYRVTGIAPAGFRGLSGAADLWIPSQLPPISEYVTMRLVRWVTVVARLRPGVTIAQAQQEMDRVTADLARRYPDSNKGMGAHVAALSDFWYGGVRHGLLVLALGALAVLIAACCDAGLLLRRRLPAGLACALAGGALGLLAAWLAARALLAAGGGLALKSWVRVAVARPEVIAAVLALALLCAPAIALAARAGRRFRGLALAAVAVQAVAAVVLLAATGLRTRDYRELVNRPLGFSPAGVLTYRIDIRGPRYDDVQPVRAVVRRLVEQLPAVPGVAQVALADPTIPTDGWAGTYISVEGHPSPAPQGTYTSMVHSVTADYFSLLRIP